ncbi:MAG: glycosyltransferase family 2 protein [Methanobacterium sp.]
MMKPKISVIVPVYNAKPYLHQCADSILGQTFSDLELILIDDGSTDGSAAICDDYARQDKRVRVLHQENSGIVSVVRNKGIAMSQGEYLTFVDADDWIEPQMYAEMLNIINSHGADIGICSYCSIYQEMNQDNIMIWADGQVFAGEEIKEQLVPAFISTIDLHGNEQQLEFTSVCRAVFRRSFLEQKQIRFDERIKYMEDFLFIVKSFSEAQKITINKDSYYNYRQNANNKNTITQRYMDGKYESRQLAKQEIINVLQKTNYLHRMQKQIAWRNCLNVINSLNNLCGAGSPLRWRERVKLARYYVTDSNFKQSLNQAGLKHFTRNQKIALILLKHSLVNTALLAYSIKNRN